MSHNPPVHARRVGGGIHGALILMVIIASLTPGISSRAEPELQAETGPPAVEVTEDTAAPPPTQPKIRPEELRQRVIEAGVLLAEQGYRSRHDHWHGRISPEMRTRIPVFLFEGNDYRFIVATDGHLRELLISVVDQAGNPHPHRTEFGGPPSTRAVSFTPRKSGLHYLQLGVAADGDPHFSCLGFVYR